MPLAALTPAAPPLSWSLSSDFAKTGFYTALGAETAQGLPNAQIFYSFLRGAGQSPGPKTRLWQLV